MDPFDLFAELILAPVPAAFADEEEAIRLVIEHRWPEGVRCPLCGSALVARRGPTFECAVDHAYRRFTIFTGTPLGSLLAPRVRMILLALRALAVDKRGIAARPLAAALGIPHVTVWRHLHRLRSLLPEIESPVEPGASVQVCGRRAPEHAAHVVTGVGEGDPPATALAADVEPTHGLLRRRLTAEGVRTWLCGTFHGVSPGYLHAYVHEALVRLRCGAREIVLHVLRRILVVRA